MWMTLNGGLLQTTAPNPDLTNDEFSFKDAKIRSGGYGTSIRRCLEERDLRALGIIWLSVAVSPTSP